MFFIMSLYIIPTLSSLFFIDKVTVEKIYRLLRITTTAVYPGGSSEYSGDCASRLTKCKYNGLSLSEYSVP